MLIWSHEQIISWILRRIGLSAKDHRGNDSEPQTYEIVPTLHPKKHANSLCVTELYQPEHPCDCSRSTEAVLKNNDKKPVPNSRCLFSNIWIPFIKMERSRNSLTFIMAISILIKQHLYISTPPEFIKKRCHCNKNKTKQNTTLCILYWFYCICIIIFVTFTALHSLIVQVNSRMTIWHMIHLRNYVLNLRIAFETSFIHMTI